mgnify:FL=1|tara:strand:- start:58150 stop:58359 length:210 start_codon:yes stop_codon:yes gene_type:complete
MYRIFNYDDLSAYTLDSLTDVAMAVAERDQGSVLLEVLDDMLGEPMYLPLIELDVQFSDQRDALLPHLV